MAEKYLTDAELAAALEEDDDVDMSDEDADSGDDPNFSPDDSEISSENESRTSTPPPRRRRVPSPVAATPPRATPSPVPLITAGPGVTVNINDAFQNIVWTDPVGRQQNFAFTGTTGMDPTIAVVLELAEPIDYFSLFLTNDIIQIMVDETNLYATQTIEKQNDITPFSRLHRWTPTDLNEMRQFIGLVGYMGIVKVPELNNYWSTSKLFSFQLPKNTMPRNRFEMLLRFWHFADNDQAVPGNRTHKLDNVFDKLVQNFKSAYAAGQKVCIDETMVPFRGRLSFRQYIPSKRHRYGIKLYKLCTDKGYTWNVSVYVGRDLTDDKAQSASENVTLKLIEDLLEEGRTLYVANFYTSVPLAYKLLEKQTHLVGTLRSNRKFIPQEIKNAKLARCEISAKESPEGVTILKWRDKRDVQMLSTCHLGTVSSRC